MDKMDAHTPYFSIIIPTYNRAGLIEKAVKSVLNQQFTNWELIVVDDGSTDNTAEVMRRFTDARVRYIYQANAERCAARNNGVAQSRGSYITFLDSDDYYLPERLQMLYHELASRKFEQALFFTGVLLDKRGVFKQHKPQFKNTSNVFEQIAVSIIHSQQVCVSRAIITEIKYDTRFRIGEDTELWLRIAAKYPVVYIENQFTVVVVDHDDRSVNLARYNSGLEQLALYKYMFKAPHPGNRIPPAQKRRMLASSYYLTAQYHTYQGHRWPALVAVVRAIFTDTGSVYLKFRFNILLHLLTLQPMQKIQKLMDY